MSLLKMNDKEESAMKQYIELEKIAQEYPKSRQRVEKLKQTIQSSSLIANINQSSLFLNQQGDPASLDEVEPNKNLVYSLDGEQLPFDVTNKTIKELRDIGFRDVVSFDMKHDPIKGGARPYMPPEEKQRIQSLTKEMQEDMNDPDSHFDTQGDANDEDEYLDLPKS